MRNRGESPTLYSRRGVGQKLLLQLVYNTGLQGGAARSLLVAMVKRDLHAQIAAHFWSIFLIH